MGKINHEYSNCGLRNDKSIKNLPHENCVIRASAETFRAHQNYCKFRLAIYHFANLKSLPLTFRLWPWQWKGFSIIFIQTALFVFFTAPAWARRVSSNFFLFRCKAIKNIG